MYYVQVNSNLYRVPLSIIQSATSSTVLSSSSYVLATGNPLTYFSLQLNNLSYHIVDNRTRYKNLTDNSEIASAAPASSTIASFLSAFYFFIRINSWFIFGSDTQAAAVQVPIGDVEPTSIRMVKRAFQPLPGKKK